MASVKHRRVDSSVDTTGAGLTGSGPVVGPSHWNDEHEVVLVKADVGLGAVDNTADSAKPVSTAQAAAIAAKADAAHTHAPAGVVFATTSRVLGRATAGGGAGEELSTSQVLDLLAATRGQVLYRGASGWAGLAPGTAGQILQTGGAGADPSWAAPSSGAPGGSNTQPQYNAAGSFAGMSGWAWDNTNRSLTVTGGTITANNPLFNLARTWNGAGVSFTMFNINLTDTASAVGSKFWEAMVSGVVVSDIRKDGAVRIGGWRLKAGSTELEVRNSDDTAYDNLRAFGVIADSFFRAANTGTFAFNGRGVISSPSTSAVAIQNNGLSAYADLLCRNTIQVPQASITPANNGDFVFEATANTAVTARFKGNDGTVRSATVPLGIVALSDGASIATNAALGQVFSVTLGGNRTLANPTNLIPGQTYVWLVSQDGTGSRTLAYGTLFDFGTAGAPTLTTAANKLDILTSIYDGTKLRVLANKGFN